MNRIEKGKYGYINWRKRSRLIKAIALFACALIIFAVGYFLNKRSTSNVFSIVTVALVLPASKVLVSYIVMHPYRTMDKNNYDMIVEHISDSMILLTDLVLTSADKVMNLDCIIITKDKILCFTGQKKQDYNYIDVYLKRGIKNRGFDYTVELYTELKDLIRTVDKACKAEEAGKSKNQKSDDSGIEEVSQARIEEEGDVISYLLSLTV